jgi:Fur family ferric uptake transcriptional regulator
MKRITKQINDDGYRMTRIRRSICRAFERSRAHLTADNIMQRLRTCGIRAHKSTIYRELRFLASQKYIRSIHLTDGIVRYERPSSNHHHHIVCLGCRRVEDVSVPPAVCKTQIRIAKMSRFRVIHHRLELSGLCHACNHPSYSPT